MMAHIPAPQPGEGLDSRVDSLWIHCTTRDRSIETSDLWFSFPRDIAASRRGIPGQEIVSFTDLRAGVKCEYDPKANKIFRLPTREWEREEFLAFAAMFRAIFRGEPPPGDHFAGDRIVGKTQRTVEENGQTWIEHELRLERAHLSATMVIRVQPDTNLPASMTLSAVEGSLRFEFDYPHEGPADIYALGLRPARRLTIGCHLAIWRKSFGAWMHLAAIWITILPSSWRIRWNGSFGGKATSGASRAACWRRTRAKFPREIWNWPLGAGRSWPSVIRGQTSSAMGDAFFATSKKSATEILPRETGKRTER